MTQTNRFLSVCHEFSSPYIEVYDARDWTKLPTIDAVQGGNGGGAIPFAIFNPDSSIMVAGTRTAPYLRRYDTSDWSLLPALAVPPLGAATHADFSPDGTLMAVAHYSGKLTIYTSAGVYVTDLSVVGTVYAVKFSVDGTRLVACSFGNPGVRVFNTADWSIVRNVTTDFAKYAEFSPDGAQMAVAAYTAPGFHVYNTADWSEASLPFSATTNNAQQVSYSPDGSLLLTVTGSGSGVRVYQTSDYALLHTVAGARWGAFSPDGELLAATATGGGFNVKLYDTTAWALMPQPTVPPAFGGGAFLAFGAEAPVVDPFWTHKVRTSEII